MKAKKRREVANYLRLLADQLELRDWTVRFVHEPCDDHALASCEIVYGRRWIDVRIHRDFFELDDEEQVNSLVHELIHAHLDGIEGVMRDARQATALPKRVGRLVQTAQHRAIEEAVDALASAFVPHAPRPPWLDR